MPTRCEVGHLFERSAQQPTFWHWLGKGSFSIKEKGSKYHVEDGLGKAGQLPAASRAVEDVASLMPSGVLPHYSQVERSGTQAIFFVLISLLSMERARRGCCGLPREQSLSPTLLACTRLCVGLEADFWGHTFVLQTLALKWLPQAWQAQICR